MALAGVNLRKIEATIKSQGPVKNYYTAKLRREIGRGLSIMRNIIVSGESNGMGADMLLLHLSKGSSMLKPTYCRMLSLIRIGRQEEAFELMKAWGDGMGEQYGRLILLWDETKANALLEVVLSFQRSLREESITESKRRDEMVSDLIYIPAVFNVMLIFVNFIYTGYFMQQQEMLRGIFG